jgi:hypothetical protein
MPRTEARIFTDIWRNERFLALDRSTQGLYMFLCSQDDLAYDGVIALRVKRWASFAGDLSPEQVEIDLKHLAEAHFVVIDYDTEELLVRALLRRDRVYRQPNVLRSASHHLVTVASKIIRRTVAEECRRILAEETLTETAARILGEMIAAGEGTQINPYADPSPNPDQMSLLDPHPDGQGKGGASSMGERGEGITTNLRTKTTPLNPPTEINTGPRTPSTHPAGTWSDTQIENDPAWQQFWRTYPRKDSKGQAKRAWLAALRKRVGNQQVAPQDLIDGAARYRDDPNRSAQYTRYASTWLNGECWLDEGAIPGPEPPGRGTEWYEH